MISGAVLKAAIGHVRKAVYSRSALPTLHCVLVERTKDALILTGTDLDVMLRISLPMFDGEEAFEVAVEGKALAVAVVGVGSKKADQVRVEYDDGALCLSGAKGRARVPGYVDADEFPPVPAGEMLAEVRGLSLDLMAAVATAAATEEERPALTGVYVDRDAKKVVAADGWQMALADVGGGLQVIHNADLPELLIPTKAVKVAVQVMKRIDTIRIVRVGEDTNYAVFTGPARAGGGGQVELLIVLIDHHFPDYSQIVPDLAAVPVSLTVNTVRALEAVEAVVMAAKAMEAGGVVLEIDAGVLRMGIYDREVGDLVVEVSSDCQRGGRTRWAADARFVQTALKALKGVGEASVTFRVGKVEIDDDGEVCYPTTPFFIEGELITWLIMPQHLSLGGWVRVPAWEMDR